jgi:hypothetical protein
VQPRQAGHRLDRYAGRGPGAHDRDPDADRHRYLSTVPTTGPPLWMEIYPGAVRLELAG